MRTTIVLDDEVFRRAKVAAAAAGVPLSRLLENCLREYLRENHGTGKSRTRRFRMVTFGAREPKVAHEPAELAGAMEMEDARRVER